MNGASPPEPGFPATGWTRELREHRHGAVQQGLGLLVQQPEQISEVWLYVHGVGGAESPPERAPRLHIHYGLLMWRPPSMPRVNRRASSHTSALRIGERASRILRRFGALVPFPHEINQTVSDLRVR